VVLVGVEVLQVMDQAQVNIFCQHSVD
jgi:hypothetical protein